MSHDPPSFSSTEHGYGADLVTESHASSAQLVLLPGGLLDNARGELAALAWRWVKWRLRTGQITHRTARKQRDTIGYFIDFVGGRRARQIGPSDLERWQADLRGRLQPSTVRTYWNTMNTFMEWLVDEGKIKRNPARRVAKPKVPRSVHRNLRPDQASAIHAACRDDRERLIVALGFQLGMRRKEIADAEVGDIDRVARTIRIVGKGGHTRVVALTVAAEKAIDAYLADTKLHAGPLVRDQERLRGISAGYIGTIWRNIALRAGVKQSAWDGVATHTARHTAGSDVAHRTGGNAVIVRDFLGHASIATTDIYIGSVDLEEQREAIEGRDYQDTA